MTERLKKRKSALKIQNSVFYLNCPGSLLTLKKPFIDKIALITFQAIYFIFTSLHYSHLMAKTNFQTSEKFLILESLIQLDAQTNRMEIF